MGIQSSLRIGSVIRYWVLALSLAIVLAAGVDTASASMPTGEQRSFCKPRMVGSFLRPLSGLPERHPVPKSGRLPFAPRALSVDEVGTQAGYRLMSGGGEFGYEFFFESPTIRRLGWIIKLQGFAVNRQGRVTQRLGTAQREIARIGGLLQPRALLAIPSRPGFYRVDLSVESSTGRKLGAYREYLRVMAPEVSVRVGLSARTIGHGDEVMGRIENIGTTPIEFGAPYSVEYLSEQGWIRVAPQRSTWPRYTAVMYAGSSGACMHFRVPPEFPAGQYRFKKAVHGVSPGSVLEQVVYGEFSVSAFP